MLAELLIYFAMFWSLNYDHADRTINIFGDDASRTINIFGDDLVIKSCW